ncbi:MAG: hypothetical protein P4L73_19700 [Caulobacteraceae bacterium]|nr:hypothetical protein [Caulobacteraceae bacterium]
MRLGDERTGANVWFADGARYGRVDVRFAPDGGLEVRRHEMGASDRAAWGEDDHEASLRLSPPAVARLALALLMERYAGRSDALEALKEFCEAQAIAADHDVWT